jgi:hypothetical protein
VTSNPGTGNPGTGVNPGNGVTKPGMASVAAFNNLSSAEQRRLIRRCRDVTGSGGYDASLVSLCRLLQASASR